MRRAGSYAVAATLLASASAGAQTSRYYLSAGDQHNMTVVQGGTVINQWTQANNTDPCCQGEYALAVSGDIRTLASGNFPTMLGSQYTLGGTYTGTAYVYPVSSGAAFFDGTTDGTYNYSVDYHNGNVWSMDRNWANAALLFTTGLGQELGITWDPNNTLWAVNFGSGTVSNWTLGGSMLSSFNTGLSGAGSLAMDYADGSLWLTSQSTLGTLYQYSTSGTFLGTSHGIADYNYLGGEFEVAAATTVPEPASIVLMASGLLALVPIARRRMRRT